MCSMGGSDDDSDESPLRAAPSALTDASDIAAAADPVAAGPAAGAPGWAGGTCREKRMRQHFEGLPSGWVAHLAPDARAVLQQTNATEKEQYVRPVEQLLSISYDLFHPAAAERDKRVHRAARTQAHLAAAAAVYQNRGVEGAGQASSQHVAAEAAFEVATLLPFGDFDSAVAWTRHGFVEHRWGKVTKRARLGVHPLLLQHSCRSDRLGLLLWGPAC